MADALLFGDALTILLEKRIVEVVRHLQCFENAVLKAALTITITVFFMTSLELEVTPSSFR